MPDRIGFEPSQATTGADASKLNGVTVPALGAPGSVLTVNPAGTGLEYDVPAAGVTPVNVQDFTSSGTWTDPGFGNFIRIILIGGGGGGGSGSSNTAANCSGGGGGGGGGYIDMTLRRAAVSSPQTVTIGAGGAGGVAVSVNGTPGNIGAAGGATSFGSLLQALGGAGGPAGLTSAAASGGAGGQGMWNGGVGGGSTTSSATIQNGSASFPFSPGGGGGGAQEYLGFINGGAGGAPAVYGLTGGAGGVGSSTAPTNGTAGTNQAVPNPGPGGGGGGSSSNSGVAAGSGASGGCLRSHSDGKELRVGEDWNWSGEFCLTCGFEDGKRLSIGEFSARWIALDFDLDDFHFDFDVALGCGQLFDQLPLGVSADGVAEGGVCVRTFWDFSDEFICRSAELPVCARFDNAEIGLTGRGKGFDGFDRSQFRCKSFVFGRDSEFEEAICACRNHDLGEGAREF